MRRLPSKSRLPGRMAVSIAVMAVALSLTACVGSQIVPDNPRLRPARDQLAAQVYFIRPRTERFLGAADNRIDVKIDRHPLLAMSKGEYTLLHLTPGKARIEVRSATTWGPEQAFKLWSRSADFSFDAQQTYYLAFIPVNGEFRGVYYRIEQVDAERAAFLVVGARPFGDAKQRPIEPEAIR